MTHPLDFKSYVREIQDFPKPGVQFKDITPLLKDARALAAAVDTLARRYEGRGVDLVAGIESRGFLVAAPLACRLKAGVVPIRKKGKLPYKTISVEYSLEYGTDCLEVHADAAAAGTKVLLADDVLATGGTAAAACRLLESLGASVVGASFLIELSCLEGHKKLPGKNIHALLRY